MTTVRRWRLRHKGAWHRLVPVCLQFARILVERQYLLYGSEWRGRNRRATHQLTNNSQWGGLNTPNVPRYYDPTLAATTNNRFVMAWTREGVQRQLFILDTAWYTVYDSRAAARLDRPPSLAAAPAVTVPICLHSRRRRIPGGRVRVALITFGQLDQHWQHSQRSDRAHIRLRLHS